MTTSVVGLVGCGDDDSTNNNADAAGDGSAVDGGDGGAPCDFNAFVTNLIATQTTPTALPSTDLGDGCTDTHTAFPAALFQ